MNLRHIIVSLCALAASAWGNTSASATQTVLAPEQSQYPESIVMMRRDASGREGLCTPVARYQNANGVCVDLVGAVHLADARYYRALNRAFARYDKVLYEMLNGEDLPEMTRLTRKVEAGAATPEEKARLKQYTDSRERGVGGDLLSAYYASMADLMKLSLQSEVVDYGLSNLVYADMSSEEFSAAMAERGESWFTLVLDSVKESSGRGVSFTAPKSGSGLKARFCRQLVASSSGSVTEGRAVIVARNARCFEVLDRLLEHEPEARRLAIFYGAMHLRDMHERLLQRGFTLQGVQWITAIRL
jgi:hypothetical protein